MTERDPQRPSTDDPTASPQDSATAPRPNGAEPSRDATERSEERFNPLTNEADMFKVLLGALVLFTVIMAVVVLGRVLL